MARNVAKFFGGMIAIVLVGVVALLAIQYLRTRDNPEFETYSETLTEEDESGAPIYTEATPGGTLHLFIDALKNGDTNRAAGFFIREKQMQWEEDLSTMKEKGMLANAIKDFESMDEIKKTDTEALYAGLSGENPIQLTIVKIGNIWKLSEF